MRYLLVAALAALMIAPAFAVGPPGVDPLDTDVLASIDSDYLLSWDSEIAIPAMGVGVDVVSADTILNMHSNWMTSWTVVAGNLVNDDHGATEGEGLVELVPNATAFVHGLKYAVTVGDDSFKVNAWFVIQYRIFHQIFQIGKHGQVHGFKNHIIQIAAIVWSHDAFA